MRSRRTVGGKLISGLELGLGALSVGIVVVIGALMQLGDRWLFPPRETSASDREDG